MEATKNSFVYKIEVLKAKTNINQTGINSLSLGTPGNDLIAGNNNSSK